MSNDQITCTPSPELVGDLVSLAWSTFVGTEVFQVESFALDGDIVCSSISIGGPWSATVLLFCRRELADRCTSTVLGLEPSELADEDVHDIMGELANIIGGNLKGIVSDPDHTWTLSLPVVSNGMQTVPGSRLVTDLLVLCDGEPLGCHVREHA
jgi:chemotaxis protein CheX